MIFIFAGHGGADVGAVGVDRRTEARETLKLRNAIASELKKLKAAYNVDDDNAKLRDVLKTAQTGSGSVVLDIHFNASVNKKANGVEVIVKDGASIGIMNYASDILAAVTSATKLKNRGIKTELDTARGTLGVMRENGLVCLLEVCFISNAGDMLKHDIYRQLIAYNIAKVLIKHDKLH